MQAAGLKALLMYALLTNQRRYWTDAPVLKRTWPYDMWSLGVAWLELVLGTRNVFQARACSGSCAADMPRMPSCSGGFMPILRLCAAPHALLFLGGSLLLSPQEAALGKRMEVSRLSMSCARRWIQGP